MKVLIATDSFKGSMTSIEVANYLEKGLKEIDRSLEITKVPISDGGEGMVEAFLAANNGSKIKLNVTGPLGNIVDSFYGISDDGSTAYIEVASAIGLYLLDKHKRNPIETTSYGVGELILDAVNRGCKNVIIGLGGSSTNDGGMGMARALGVKFLSKSGEELLGFGFELGLVDKIDISNLDSRLKDVNFRIACDVDNPLTGKKGAAHTFASQKGASYKEILQLEKGMINYQNAIKESLGIDVSRIKGGGAAGGLGAGLVAYLNADIVPGIKLIIEETNLEEKIKNVDLVITGEGKIDNQTLHGKVPAGISALAKKYNKRTIAIAGKVDIEEEVLKSLDIHSVLCITPKGQSIDEAMKRGKENTFKIAKVIYEKHLINF
ncbi:glycerate kinase [Thermohalobacter berrensis]|uniref:Glycerate kinase n=1 Tax=Thermohalobacter berrensis TaxID=99594 RepID=A0A419SWB1_9FIRM|nr:glycerate kinase [Thermohalobacter berrensis]RKD29499.1 hypothetical protein BET03_05415 [Thermohalobacter berrensis]